MVRCIWDITQRLRPDIPVWPGDTKFARETSWDMTDGSPVQVSKITLSTHTGAHADAPLHYAQGADDIADVLLEPYLGECLVVDACEAGELIEPQHVPELAGATRVLFRTYDQFPHDVWAAEHTAIAPQTIELLAENNVALVGMDGPSLDPQSSKTMDAHLAVLAAEMRVLEGLVLDHVPTGRYELIALPLPIVGGDASPVRAILREIS